MSLLPAELLASYKEFDSMELVCQSVSQSVRHSFSQNVSQVVSYNHLLISFSLRESGFRFSVVSLGL